MLKRNALFCAILLLLLASPNSRSYRHRHQEASTQDIPVAVNALGEEALDQLGITTLPTI